MLKRTFKIIKRYDTRVLNILTKYKIIIFVLFVLGISIDIFFSKYRSDILLFSLLALWIVIIRINRYQSSISFKLSLLFLIGLFVSFLINRKSPVNDELVTWIYLLLGIGVVHSFWDLRK